MIKVDFRVFLFFLLILFLPGHKVFSFDLGIFREFFLLLVTVFYNFIITSIVLILAANKIDEPGGMKLEPPSTA